jgi:cytochrome P450
MHTFEIRLRDIRPAACLLFVASRETDAEAIEHARLLLERHPEYPVAEIWQGMKLLRQI